MSAGKGDLLFSSHCRHSMACRCTQTVRIATRKLFSRKDSMPSVTLLRYTQRVMRELGRCPSTVMHQELP